MKTTYTCVWCKKSDIPLTVAEETRHLFNCPGFQGARTAEIYDGKEFVRVPNAQHILVERWPRRVN